MRLSRAGAAFGGLAGGRAAEAEAAYRRAADLFDNAGPRFTQERDEALALCRRLATSGPPC